jgi:undecaprenyl-diphosphatase
MTPEARSRFVRRWGLQLGAAIVLAVLLVWDRQVFAAVQGFRSPFLTWLTDRVSQLHGATFPAAVGLLLIAIGIAAKQVRLRRAGLAMILAVIISGAVTSAMKELIARPGPRADNHIQVRSWLETRYGRFPSSHSAVMFSAASVLSAFVPPAAIPAFTVATLVCYERIYKSTHFPSDIFAGIWIGLIVARLLIARLIRWRWIEDVAPAPAKPGPPDLAGYPWSGENRDISKGEGSA